MKYLKLLGELFGPGRHTTGENYIFHCPVCKHRKPKLEIDIDSKKWHCWVCSRGGRSVYSLLKYINAAEDIFIKFSEFLSKTTRRTGLDVKIAPPELVHLPKEFIPLWVDDPNNWFWRSAVEYLINKRKFRLVDIIKYRIGYCTDGPFQNRVIFPNYNSYGELDFYIGRLFLDVPGDTYKLPRISRKNVVGLDFFIDWSEPVIIVESYINAVTIRKNVCPLYGKVLSAAVRRKILANKTPEIIMALDRDAIVQSVDAILYLIGNGVPVRFVQFADDNDINSIGYERSMNLINNAKYITQDDIFKFVSTTAISSPVFNKLIKPRKPNIRL